MRRTAAHAPCNIHMARAQIRILIPLGHQSRFDRYHTINLLPVRHPSRINQIFGLGAQSLWRENLKLAPSLYAPHFRLTSEVRKHTSLGLRQFLPQNEVALLRNPRREHWYRRQT